MEVYADFRTDANDLEKGMCAATKKAKRMDGKLYLFYGEDDYLVSKGISELIKSIAPEGESVNVEVKDGSSKNLDLSFLFEPSLPFSSEASVVLINGAEGILADKAKVLLEHIESRTDTDSGVLILKSNDKKFLNMKVYKSLAPHATVKKYEPVKDSDFKKSIKTVFKEKGIAIDNETVEFIFKKTGKDTRQVLDAAEKSKLFYGDAGATAKLKLSSEMLQPLLPDNVEFRAFDIVDLICSGNIEEAVRETHRAFSFSDKPPREIAMQLLNLLARQFRMILKLNAAEEQGLSRSDAMEYIGVGKYWFLWDKLNLQSSSFNSKKSVKALEGIATAFDDILGGAMEECCALDLFLLSLQE